MNEQEQQNQNNSFLKSQLNMGKEAVKNETKKQGKKLAKKIIIKILSNPLTWKVLAIVLIVSSVITLLASFFNMIIGYNGKNVNDAKHTSIITNYSGDTSTIYQNEDGEDANRVIINQNGDNDGYQIDYNDNDEELEKIETQLKEENPNIKGNFSDAELAIFKALIDNGADLQYYTEEELHCFLPFIKAEASTQNLDLRPNSEKIVNGEYVPQRIEDLDENEIPGVILVQRTNTNSTGTSILEYKVKSEFDELIEQNNKDVIKYFTVDEKGDLVIAKWDHILITVEGEYPENLDDSEKDVPKDETIISTEKIAYNQYISRYKMPFEFLIYLLNTTEEPTFCKEMVNYVLNSKIVINIQEEETITVTDETKQYTAHSKDEKYINYTVSAAQQQIEQEENYFLNNTKDDENNDCTNYLKNESTVKVHREYTTHSYAFEIIEADTWIAHYKKTYAAVEPDGPTTAIEDPEPYKGEYEQVELDVEQPITDEETITNDGDVNEFVSNKQKDYEPKISVPELTVEDKETSDGNSKEINASGEIEKIEISDNEVELPISYPEIEGKYNLPTRIIITSKKVASTPKTKEIPQIKYIYSINSDETEYILQNDIDPLVECKVSSLNIKQYEKMDFDNYIETTITKYPSDENPTTQTHIYSKDENGNFEKFLKSYDKSTKVQSHLNSIDSWLFELMEEDENTIELVDIIKYLLYIYDGKDRGVTELDLGLFEGNEFVTIGNNSDWWWPIGSSNVEIINGVKYASGEPVETIITSGVGPRWGRNHGGIDVSNGVKGTNIIAAKAGTVTVVVDGFGNGHAHVNGVVVGSQKVCNGECKQGGGYGNHVKILHDDGTSSVYAHLERGTIKVSQGDRVEQGQLLGGMGTSGSSTGYHLHFEIRDANNNRLDPEEYVDPENPRPASSSSLRDWLWGIEGGTQHINGNIWTVFDPVGGDDTMNLAHGMVVASYNGGDSWYPDIIPGKITVGQTVTEEQANKIWEVKIKGFSNAIDSACAKHGVTLTAHQKDALVSYIYRTGYGRGQNNSIVSAYKDGGNAGLWNYMKNGYDKRAIYEVGTKARVAEEYELFVKGDYNYNPSGKTKYDQFCSNPNI